MESFSLWGNGNEENEIPKNTCLCACFWGRSDLSLHQRIKIGEEEKVMGSVDYIILGIILAIIGGACFYIYRAKKNGQKCVGCPHSSSCTGACTCNHNNIEEK